MGTYTGQDKRLQYLFQNGGGGGTTVIANPAGQATDTLNKLQVGSTIYSVPSGGGGGFSVDYTNPLYVGESTSFKNVVSYTATQKCIAYVDWNGSSTTGMYPVLNSTNLNDFYTLSNRQLSHSFILQSGDTLAKRYDAGNNESCYFKMRVYPIS